MKKRVLCFVLALLLLGLSACQNLGKKPAALQSKIPIPKDGVIAASVLEALKEQNKAAAFYGESGGISYEWILFGRDLQEIKDFNFGIEILQASGEKVAFRYLSQEDFGFSPVLSICLKEPWDGDGAAVYPVSGGAAQCEVCVTGGKAESILNFSTARQTGSFEIRADALPAQTDAPVPAEKPLPVEPDDQAVDKEKTYTCTFSIECTTILNHLGDLEPDELDEVPSDGIIFPAQSVTFYEGESVFDVLQRVCKENGIQMEASWTPMYNSAYIEGIHNLYAFDCGSGSGWMYSVNGWYPNYGCSRYQLAQGDIVRCCYTCDLGADLGAV